MPRVFRQQYTRPIPPNAERVTIENKKGEPVPAVRFRASDGKTITAPVVTRGKNAGTSCRVAVARPEDANQIPCDRERAFSFRSAA